MKINPLAGRSSRDLFNSIPRLEVAWPAGLIPPSAHLTSFLVLVGRVGWLVSCKPYHAQGSFVPWQPDITAFPPAFSSSQQAIVAWPKITRPPQRENPSPSGKSSAVVRQAQPPGRTQTGDFISFHSSFMSVPPSALQFRAKHVKSPAPTWSATSERWFAGRTATTNTAEIWGWLQARLCGSVGVV